MKELNAEQLRNLSYGQKVHRFINGQFRGLRFVAKMPSCNNYLIFEDGEYLTYLHISSKDGTYNGRWFDGYDSKIVGQILIEDLKKDIERVERVYFN